MEVGAQRLHRPWLGERDLGALIAGCDENSAAVVAMILTADGASRARSHCRSAPALIHFIPVALQFGADIFETTM